MTPKPETRVHRGAKFLDKVRPGWARKVRLTRFDISDECGCILGQLEGDYMRATEILLGDNQTKVELMGFDCFENEPGTYPALQAAWEAEIRARRVKP